MTPLYEILQLANEALLDYEGSNTRIEKLASYVVDHLGPLLECGYESPVVNYNYQDKRIDIPEYTAVPVEDAKTIAATIFRVCDEALDSVSDDEDVGSR